MEKKRLEFGNAISYTTQLDNSMIPEFAKESMKHMENTIKEELSCVRDMEFIGETEFIEAPTMDILNRFKGVGFRFVAASNDYDVLKKHFTCRGEHVPNNLTQEFIFQLMERMIREKISREEEEDY